MTDADLLRRARVFDAGPPPTINQFILAEDDDEPGGISNVTVEWRGETGWAICSGRCCVDKESGDLEYEPMPSSRTDDYIARTRFASAQEAFAYLAVWKPRQREAARQQPGMLVWKEYRDT